ncbi:hypothetical protein [Amycolatopsis australiensis]|nr:hypothetical protein [Amycolatopsis australiensis]
MSSSWPPPLLLMAAMTAALAWRRARPVLVRAVRCAAATCLALWSLRVLGDPAATAPPAALRRRAPRLVLTVVLGSPLGQGAE